MNDYQDRKIFCIFDDVPGLSRRFSLNEFERLVPGTIKFRVESKDRRCDLHEEGEATER